jgi:hypothetical protein
MLSGRIQSVIPQKWAHFQDHILTLSYRWITLHTDDLASTAYPSRYAVLLSSIQSICRHDMLLE